MASATAADVESAVGEALSDKIHAASTSKTKMVAQAPTTPRHSVIVAPQ